MAINPLACSRGRQAISVQRRRFEVREYSILGQAIRKAFLREPCLVYRWDFPGKELSEYILFDGKYTSPG